MKTVADSLGVSRSNLAKRAVGLQARNRYFKIADAWLLPLIRGIAGSRPIYGYSRASALLNQELMAQG